MKKNVRVAASILAADFGRLLEDIKSIEEAGADMIHVDVMDGHFVPNITVGIPVIASLKGRTSLPLDVHLMIENPARYIKQFAEAGSDFLTVHVEIGESVGDIIPAIAAAGAGPGLSLNPETPASSAEPYLDIIDSVLVMTVNPGFGGQAFKPGVISKIKELREQIDRGSGRALIAVDGGVNAGNSADLVSAGADILVAGTAVFGPPDRKKAIRLLRGGGNV